MKLEQSFEVEAPIDQVWEALVDVERVTPCLPGASVTGRNDDGTYNGTFTIRIGPTTASYTGKLEMQNVDESSRTATMYAQGSDKRGQGGATATINSRLSPLDGRTRVEVVTDYHITGRLARFGRGGMIEDISERLLREFATRLQASLTYFGEAAGGAVATVAGETPGGATGGMTGGATGEMTGGATGAEETLTPAPIEDAASEQPTTETARVSNDQGSAWASGGRAPEEAASPAAEPVPEEAAAPAAEPEPPTEAATPPEPEPPAPWPPPRPAPEAPAEPPAPPAAEVPPPPHAAPPPPPPPPPPHAAPPPPPPPSEPSEPIEGLSLVGSVLVQRIKRNPIPVIGVIGGLVVLRMIFRRR